MSNTYTVKRGDLEAWPEYQYLTILLTCLFFQKGIDFLKNSPYHKQRLKNGVAIVQDELKTMIEKDLTAVCSNGEHTRMYLLADNIEDLLHEVLVMKPEFVPVVVEMIKRLRDDPATVLNFFGMNLTDDLPENS